jgi:serine/threonine protein kinase
MSLAPGTRLGHFEITGSLGAGGMGEVYRARDTRLGRDVAIKVLPPEFARDAERLGRFENEARAAAALNHPNILAVHDVGAENGVAFMVAELVEGQTLRQLLDDQTLTVSRVIDLAGQMADGLAAAHARGLVHRDLKPENVIITPESRAKILDFGLARSVTSENAAEASAPTRVVTAPHMVLGTAGYMSPEQAKGQPADHRSDVFAFGCVLYEMLSGKRAFPGETAIEAMSAVVREAPAPPTSTPARPMPPALLRIVERCLEKSPSARFQSTIDLAFALKSLSSVDSGATVVGASVAAAPIRRALMSWLPWSVAAAAVLASAAMVWSLSRAEAPAPPSLPLTRLPLPLPHEAAFSENSPIAPFPAVSPDGRYLALLLVKGNAPPSLWLHSMKGLEARHLVAESTQTNLPFWSPDGRSIGFFSNGRLKRVDVESGVVQDLAAAIYDGGNTWGGGAWSPDGTIIFGGPNGLERVPAGGGTPTPLTTFNAERKDVAHRHPTFLPDGRHFLFQVYPERAVWMGSLDEPGTTRLMSADSKAVYAPPGWLLFVRQNTLFAQRFDAATRQLGGEPVPVVDNVRTNEINGRSAFGVSANGVLAYRGGDVHTAATLTWIDREGRTVGTLGDSPAIHNTMAFVPGDRTLITHIHDDDREGGDLWAVDLERGSRVRVVTAPGHDFGPVVSPDGARLAWTSARSGRSAIYQKSLNGPGEPSLWIDLDVPVTVSGLNRNWVVFSAQDTIRGLDIWVAPVDDVGKRRPYVQTDFSESSGVLSPDERWMAYRSNESGSNEVYVRPFPDAQGGVWRISSSGGAEPRWGADGRELFYFMAGGGLASVTFDGARAIPVIGQPRLLLRDVDATPSYLALSTGQRFLVARRPPVGEAPLTIITNWLELVAGR